MWDVLLDLIMLFRWPLLLLGAIAGCYILVRVGSIAHFRTKAEYDDRSRHRGLANGETNAKE